MFEWISVEDHLPEQDIKDGKKEIKVFVYIQNKVGGCMRTETRRKDYYGNWVWGKYSPGEVTHWAYLPSKPNKDKFEKRLKQLNPNQKNLFERFADEAIQCGYEQGEEPFRCIDKSDVKAAANEFLESIGYKGVYELD